MADMKPLTVTAAGQYQLMQPGDTVPVDNGGTGATTPEDAAANLGLEIGVDVQGYTLDAENLHALNPAVGIPARIAPDTWAMRILVGSARIGVTDGNGVLGNPAFDLTAYPDAGGGAMMKFTRDAQGLVSGTTPISAVDITTLLDPTYVNVAGDTMTGFLSLHADPTSAMHAVTKQYADGIASGLKYKTSARAATTADIVLSGPQTIDGVAVIAGDRVLVKDQAMGFENGIYVVAGGTWTRALDADATGELDGGTTLWVNEGATQADTGWTVTNDGSVVIGTTAVVFTQTSGLGQTLAGAGLTKTGNTLDVGTASVGRIVVNPDNIDLAAGIVTPGSYTKLTVDTYGRVVAGAAATAAEIGAQPLDPTLSALAGFNTNGILVQIAADSFAGRQIVPGPAATITITNPDGVAGNITLEQPAGIIAPGTYSGVTVDTYGRVTSGTAGASASLLTDAFVNAEAVAIVIGRAIYATATSGQVALANANNDITAQVIGLVSATSIAAGASGAIAFAGVFAATAGQWDVVTGQTGGLTPGAMYFVSNTTAGGLTTTAPSTGFLAPVGRALSTTKMALRFDPTVQL